MINILDSEVKMIKTGSNEIKLDVLDVLDVLRIGTTDNKKILLEPLETFEQLIKIKEDYYGLDI